MSLYSQEIKQIVEAQRKRCPSHGLIFDVVDYNSKYLTLRLYRDNFEEFSDNQRLGISMWISETMQLIRSIVPCYLEVFESVPRR